MSESRVTRTAPSEETTGRRLALIVAVTDYLDTSLDRLRAPAGDAAELRDLLADPDIGGFSVTSVINERAHQVRVAIEDFLADRRLDDLLLVYLSCHGLVDARRRLYFAARDTFKNRLASSGVEAHWLLEQLEDCRARRQVVILDCCFSGAFARGAKGDDDLGLGDRLLGDGRGRVVLTASRGTEYSFEGEPLTGQGTPRGSVFTSALVEGIRTGRADTDHDGDISVEDAYVYAYEQVRRAGTAQTPQRWLYGAEGSIVLAHALPEPEPAELAAPPEPEPGIPTAAEPVAATASVPSPATRRRVMGLAGLGAGALAVAVVIALVSRGGDGDGGGAGGDSVAPDGGTGTRTAVTSTTGTLRYESPWRLGILDNVSDVTGQDDNGCQVVLTNQDTGTERRWDDFYGLKTFQMRESGTFHYRVSSPGCELLPHPGAGPMVRHPFAWSGQDGDTPVFEATGLVPVEVGERNGTSTCELVLQSDSDGVTLDRRELSPRQRSVRLEPDGPGRVYIAATSCDFRVLDVAR